MAWFKLNETNEDARKYLYTEIPEHFRFVQNVQSGRLGDWVMRDKKWKIIVRIYRVSPKDKKLYALRLLLFNVRGATSFHDLVSFTDQNGIIVSDPEEKCKHLGLLRDDKQHYKAVEEAIQMEEYSKLRNFLVMLTAFNYEVPTLELWKKYKNEFVFDIKKKATDMGIDISDEIAFQIGLIDIEKLMNEQGLHFDQFGFEPILEENRELSKLLWEGKVDELKRKLRIGSRGIDAEGNPIEDSEISDEYAMEIIREMDSWVRTDDGEEIYLDPNRDTNDFEIPYEYDDALLQGLNADQIVAFLCATKILKDGVPGFDIFMERNGDNEFGVKLQNPDLITDVVRTKVKLMTSQHHKCLFIDGPGGTGKTYTYNRIIQYCKKRGIIISCFAYTGIAASLLEDGKTLHSGFGIPLSNTGAIKTTLPVNSIQRKRLNATQVILIDEISMVPKGILEFISMLMKQFKNMDDSGEHFGGCVVFVGGDLRQILPVIIGGNESSIVSNCVVKSYLWRNFISARLTINQRALNDPEFSEWQLRIGERDGIVRIPKENVVKDVVETIFGELKTEYERRNAQNNEVGANNNQRNNQNQLTQQQLDYFTKRVILATTNDSVTAINKRIIEWIEGEELKSYSNDFVDVDDNEDFYTEETLNHLNPSGSPPHELVLKKNAVVMLIRNVDTMKGLCNGTRCIVLDMKNEVLKVRVLSGPSVGEDVIIPKITMTPTDTRRGITFNRQQFPVLPAFSMTINKSQGQSFDYVGVDLTDKVFSHGQLYVAVSRCISSQNLKIQLKPPEKYEEKQWYNILNVVYRQVLELANITPW